MTYDLRWIDIGRSLKPGSYPFRGQKISIRLAHIHRWRDDPEGVWEVHAIMLPRGKSRLAIRAFRPSGRHARAEA